MRLSSDPKLNAALWIMTILTLSLVAINALS